MPVRHEYKLVLEEAARLPSVCAPADARLRGISPADTHQLAELMLDAYRGTIDYEGEGPAEAVAEVESYFSRAAFNPAVSQCSLALHSGDLIICACLVEFWRRREVPFIAFVICRAVCKRQGLGSYTLCQTIDRLRQAGHSELRTIITEGNLPSETLFKNAGFRKVQ